MKFNNFKEMRLKLETFKMCGMGSQGVCYLDVNNKRVYKIFHEFYDEYEDRWQFKYDTYYSEDYDYTVDLRGVLTNKRIYRKLRKWNLPKGTKLNFRGFSKDCYWEFDLIIK